MSDIIVRLNGGLGNQMFQYAFAKAKARAAGARLLVDRSFFDLPYVPERYRLDAFNLALAFTGPVQNLLTRALLSPKLPANFRRILASTLSTAIEQDGEPRCAAATGPYRPAGARRRSIFIGYYQRFDEFSHLVNELRDEFRVPNARLGPMARGVLSKIETTQSVAVHVRRGDYVRVPLFAATLGVLDAEYYRRAIEAMRGCVASVTFFIFSDDPEWTRREFASQPGVTVVDLGPESSGIVDMALMRACAHFIIANSTFSWWSAFLADRPGKIVLAPKPWFISDDLGYEARVPAAWTPMASNF